MPTIVDLDSRDIPTGCPVWTLAEKLFPPQGAWSDEEYLSLDRGFELVDRHLEILPVPNAVHQTIQNIINLALIQLLGIYRVQTAGYRLKVAGGFREPDVLATLDQAAFGNRYATAADLVVEIISEDARDRQRDEVKKPAIYAAAGVAEYWIVDPFEQTVRQLILDGDTYRDAIVHDRTAVIRSHAIDGLEIDVNGLLEPVDRITD